MSDAPTPFMEFYDNLVPVLEAGKVYTLTVNQSIDGIDTQDYFESLQQPFEVRASQFALDPSSIHGAYPPPNSSGRYDEDLAHIVLDNPILPWERELFSADKTTPWLALLVFRAGELATDPATGSDLVATTVSTLLTQSDTVVRPTGLSSTVPTDVLASTCQTIIVPGELLLAVAPSHADLRYLAHVRQVDQSAQPGPSGDGWYSVIVANRFPDAAGGAHRAHLVSLEGFGDYLQMGATPPTGADGPKPFQLASLASWTFTSIATHGESFEDLVQGFVANQGEGGSALLLRIPAPPGTPGSQLQARLNAGYAPLPYVTEPGDETFAWYRGPCTPSVAQPLPKPGPHLTSASQALIYVEAEGVFDISYAAAWSAGRSLALADPAFGPALLGFRRAARRLVTTLLQRLGAEGLGSAADLDAVVAAAPFRAQFDAMLAGDLGPALTEAVHAPPAARRAALHAAAPSPPVDPVSALRQLLGAADIQALLAQALTEQLEPVASWLARLRLLYGLPFAHLVSDERMLPPESLCFFHLDAGWTGALVDGALSVGVAGTFDATVTGLLAGVIEDAVDAEAIACRRLIAGSIVPPGLSDPDAPVSGLLLRSALVPGWPGLVVSARAAGTSLELLRLDRLSPGILLALFLGVPDAVTLQEPQQGLQFGHQDGDVVDLRAISGQVGSRLGRTFPATGGLNQFLRPVRGGLGGGVLRFDDGMGGGLVHQLAAALTVDGVGPAEVAIEMVRAAEQQPFEARD
jgi:hypothetical protein